MCGQAPASNFFKEMSSRRRPMQRNGSWRGVGSPVTKQEGFSMNTTWGFLRLTKILHPFLLVVWEALIKLISLSRINMFLYYFNGLKYPAFILFTYEPLSRTPPTYKKDIIFVEQIADEVMKMWRKFQTSSRFIFLFLSLLLLLLCFLHLWCMVWEYHKKYLFIVEKGYIFWTEKCCNFWKTIYSIAYKKSLLNAVLR